MSESRARLIAVINSLNLAVVPRWQVSVFKNAALCLAERRNSALIQAGLDHVAMDGSWYIVQLATRVSVRLEQE